MNELGKCRLRRQKPCLTSTTSKNILGKENSNPFELQSDGNSAERRAGRNKCRECILLLSREAEKVWTRRDELD